MADGGRLSIEQVRAPDFSASSEMLKAANESFVSGIESAKGILGKYNEGQQNKADGLLLNDLAGLKSEEELANFLATTDLSKLNLSDKMRENILGARANILGNDATRQSTVNAADSNSRANAGESRVAAEYADGVAARDELRGLTPAYAAAYAEGHQNGQGTPSPALSGSPVGPTVFRATEQHYGLPEGYLARTAQIESGGDPNAHNASGADGLFQFVPSTAQQYGVDTRDAGSSTDGAARLAADNAATLRSKLGRDPTSAELYLAHQQGAGGASALLANPNARAVDIVGEAAVRQNGGDVNMTAGEFAGLWINKFNNGGGVQGAITSNAPQGPAGAAFAAALMHSTKLTPDQARGFLDDQYASQAAGQTLIDAAEAKRQAEVGAAAQIAAIQNPNNLTPDAVTNDLLSTDGLSAANQLAIAGQDRSAFNGVIAPTVAPDARTTAAAELAQSELGRQAIIDPALQANNRADAFTNGEASPGTVIAGSLPGAADNPALSSGNIDTAIDAFAQAQGISRGEAAAVFEAVGQGNPELMSQLVTSIPGRSPDGQFGDTSVSDTYKSLQNMSDRMFGPDARAAADAARVERTGLSDQIARNQGNILEARTSAAKLPKGSTERAQAEARVRQMEVVDQAMNQPTKTKAATADYLQIEPYELGSLTPDFKRQAEAQINSDQSLSDEQKLLLITGLRM